MTNDPYEEKKPTFLDPSSIEQEVDEIRQQMGELNQQYGVGIQEEDPDTTVQDTMIPTKLEPQPATQPEPEPEPVVEENTETTQDGKIKGIADKEFLKAKFTELKSIKNMPDGPEKEAAMKAWNIKYYGKEHPNFLERYTTNTLRQEVNPSAIGGPAAALGLVDTFTDTANLIPGVNIPKLPEFESQALQGTRQLFGLILPMRILKGAVAAKAVKVHKSGAAPQAIQKLGNDRLFRWFSDFGLEIGTGATVDYIAKQNEKDDNLAGVAKKSLPKFFQWIPDSIATNDTDSPSQKRTKNVREGALLQTFGSMIEGLAMIAGAGKSIKRAGTQFIPKNELAAKNINNLTTDEFSDIKFDDDPVTNAILKSKARDQKALDDLGKHYLADDPSYSSPKIGRDDVFDANETAVRPVDPDGVPGAAVDAARIADDIDTGYGRLGAIQSESDLVRSISSEALANKQATKAVAKTIRDMGEFDAKLPSGKVVSSKQIDAAGIRLAEILNDPRMVPGELKLMLDEFKSVTDNGLQRLDRIGNKAVKKSIKDLSDEFFSMDMEKARAYLATSNAGQISDIAEGGRLMDGTTAVARAQDRILDRLEFLMVEQKLAKTQNGLRRIHLKGWQEAVNTGDPNIMSQTVDIIKDDIDSKLLQIIPETKKYINTLRGIKDEFPEFLRPFMLANELTDGNIDSLHKLHTFTQHKLGTFSKAFVDGNPDVPSIMVRTQMGIIFNSALSSLATPIRALYGNMGGIIGKPVSVFSGALQTGDLQVLRRAFHQYAGFVDSVQKGLEHMKVVYRKAATNPTKVSYIMRDDIAIKEVKELQVLEETAKAYSAKGEDGALALLSIWKEQDALSKHPWMRFGANSMTALDGFNRAMYASAEAKGRAFDAIMDAGDTFNRESLENASNRIYKTFFDENDMITDEAVDYTTREAALNLDSELVNGMNNVVRRVPLLRSIFMFPKTQANSLDIFRKWSPIDAMHIGHKFEGDFAAFTKMDYDDMPTDEVDRLLRSKGIDPTKNPELEFRTKAAEYRGRVAIGTTTLFIGALAAMNGRIRGNGHWDPQVQRTRRLAGWETKTVQGLDGKWYSYSFLGPIGDLLAASTDLVDNFDSISTGMFEKMQYKLAFILGAALTDRSLIGSMEPVYDILAGNTSAINTWAVSFGNNWMPFAGTRRDLSKLIAPMKREYDSEILELARNRNNFLDIFDPDGALEYKYNFISGKQIGKPENMWARVNNTFNEIKVGQTQSTEEQFLLDLEFDSKPYFNTSRGGIKYTSKQRGLLYSKVGEMGIFNEKLKTIMKDAKRLTYTDNEGNTYTGFVEIMKAIRRGNISEDIISYKKYSYIIPRINAALTEASDLAEYALRDHEEFANLSIDANLQYQRGELVKQGEINKALTLEEQYKSLQEQVQSR